MFAVFMLGSANSLNILEVLPLIIISTFAKANSAWGKLMNELLARGFPLSGPLTLAWLMAGGVWKADIGAG